MIHFCTWEPYTNKEDAINFINAKVIPHPWFRAICLNSQPIGAISRTKNFDNDKCRGKLGYVLGSKYWHRGIATKAVNQVANTIFAEKPHSERFEAIVDAENVSSQSSVTESLVVWWLCWYDILSVVWNFVEFRNPIFM